MFVFHAVDTQCLFFFFDPNSLVYIYLHLSSTSQVHSLFTSLCIALLFCLLFFLNTAHMVVGNNPQTPQITVFFCFQEKKHWVLYNLWGYLCQYGWILANHKIFINYYMFMNCQPEFIAQKKSVKNTLTSPTFAILQLFVVFCFVSF